MMMRRRRRGAGRSLRRSGRRWFRTNRTGSLQCCVSGVSKRRCCEERTALGGSALGVSILRSAVTSKGDRDQREEGEGGEAHYDYD
jgi:hypothetical protein